MPDKPLPEHFRSTGHIAAQIQRDVAEVELVLQVVAILPAFVQNGVRYYDNAACDLIKSNLIKRPDYLEPGKPATKS